MQENTRGWMKSSWDDQRTLLRSGKTQELSDCENSFFNFDEYETRPFPFSRPPSLLAQQAGQGTTEAMSICLKVSVSRVASDVRAPTHTHTRLTLGPCQKTSFLLKHVAK